MSGNAGPLTTTCERLLRTLSSGRLDAPLFITTKVVELVEFTVTDPKLMLLGETPTAACAEGGKKAKPHAMIPKKRHTKRFLSMNSVSFVVFSGARSKRRGIRRLRAARDFNYRSHLNEVSGDSSTGYANRFGTGSCATCRDNRNLS